MNELIHYDIIGDLHGRYDKLAELVTKMGYRPAGDGFIPPIGHKALFLGDLIDPKPGYALPGGVRATLKAVKAMIDAGHALSLMGNHELNAIFYYSKRSEDGPWIRPHNEKNVRMHEGTLADFPDHADPASEWRAVWLPWFKKLPFHLDMGSFRAVHATWHSEFISEIGDRNLDDAEFFLAAANESKSEWEALETLLKGVEIDLPDGHSYSDHTGVVRNNMRAKWWELPAEGIHFDELVFPSNPEIPNIPVKMESFARIPSYPLDAPPVFFGHYFKPADSALYPERENVACLDHSAAKEGPLVAYRWKGEARIKPEHYVCSSTAIKTWRAPIVVLDLKMMHRCRDLVKEKGIEYGVPPIDIVDHVRNKAADRARKEVWRIMVGEWGLSRGQVAAMFGRDLRRLRKSVIGV